MTYIAPSLLSGSDGANFISDNYAQLCPIHTLPQNLPFNIQADKGLFLLGNYEKPYTLSSTRTIHWCVSSIDATRLAGLHTLVPVPGRTWEWTPDLARPRQLEFLWQGMDHCMLSHESVPEYATRCLYRREIPAIMS